MRVKIFLFPHLVALLGVGEELVGSIHWAVLVLAPASLLYFGFLLSCYITKNLKILEVCVCIHISRTEKGKSHFCLPLTPSQLLLL